MIGVCYIVYGYPARREAGYSIMTLRQQHPEMNVTVIGEKIKGYPCIPFETKGTPGRWAKVNLYDLSPYDTTIYLDADTRVHRKLTPAIQMLEDGWDMAIIVSKCQEEKWLWHVNDEEREQTLVEIGCPIAQLGGGVIFFNKNPRVKKFFTAWREEWLRWQDQDQAALLRALVKNPVKLWPLNMAWNSGHIIEHRFGAARQSIVCVANV